MFLKILIIFVLVERNKKKIIQLAGYNTGENEKVLEELCGC